MYKDRCEHPEIILKNKKCQLMSFICKIISVMAVVGLLANTLANTSQEHFYTFPVKKRTVFLYNATAVKRKIQGAVVTLRKRLLQF